MSTEGTLVIFLALMLGWALLGAIVPHRPGPDVGVYMPGPDTGAWPG
ncbi:MAG: hypothetical protein WC829_04410 [Hyphomicrobium sp.]